MILRTAVTGSVIFQGKNGSSSMCVFGRFDSDVSTASSICVCDYSRGFLMNFYSENFGFSTILILGITFLLSILSSICKMKIKFNLQKFMNQMKLFSLSSLTGYLNTQ